MDMGILSTDWIDDQPSRKLPDRTDCRICWSPIIGQGYQIYSLASSHEAVTFAQMYLHVSGVEPLDDPESLCWGCAKDLTFAYKVMKKVEEKEKIGRDYPELKAKRQTGKKVEAKKEQKSETKPSVMEMVVIKVEPEDYDYENESQHSIEGANFDDIDDGSDYSSSSSSDDSSEDDEKDTKKSRKSTLNPAYQIQKKFGNKPNVIQCALCYYNTRIKENYEKHVFDHHANQGKLKCDGCDQEYLFIYELEVHRREEHDLTDRYKAPVQPNWVLPPSEDHQLSVKQETSDASEVKNESQVTEEKQYKLDILGRRIPLNRVYKKREVKYPKKERKLPITCPLCPYTGIGKSNFRNHYRVKHNKQELQCDGCDLKFHLFYRLYRHREEEHNFSHEYVVDESLKVTYEHLKDRARKPYERKPKHGQYYPCTICDKVLAGPRKLKAHHWEVHKYVKERTTTKVICDYCGKFIADQNLEYHIRHLHPEQRDPYICHHCGESLKSKTVLLRHFQSVHKLGLSQRGAKCALMCKYCSEVFKTKHLRMSHEVRIHTFDYKFNCTLCVKKFFIRRHLAAHMKAHAKGKIKNSKLKCHICGECFSRKQILAEHINTHYSQEVSTMSDNLAKNLAHLVALKYENQNENSV